MDILWQDLRHAVRTLRRDFGFTAGVVLTLAIGVSANTAVFGVVRSILLEPLPYVEPDRLVMLWTDVVDQGVHESPSAYANIQDWRAQNRVFEDLATFDPTTLTVTDGEWPEQISSAWVASNLFSVYGVAPAVGRTFSADEEQRQARVVVLSHAFWQRRFGGARDAIGRSIEIAGEAFQVIGVMPEEFGRGTELWLPQTLFADWQAMATRRGTDAWRVIARLRKGVTVEQARADMTVVARRLEQMYPSANAGLGVRVVPLHEQVTGDSFRLALWTLFGAVALVLLIACSNVAHLFLVRGISRARDSAVRVALGATGVRLIRHALTESLVLSVAAGVIGVFLAVTGLRLFVAVAPGNVPRLHEVAVDSAMVIYGIAVALAAGMLLGILPVLRRRPTVLYDALREGHAPSRRTPGHRARQLLIAAQFAFAIVLVFGANLLIRSLLEARRVELGFKSANVLMTNLSVAAESRRVSFYERLVHEVRSIPGVRAAGIVEDLFISGAPNLPITVDGRAAEAASFAEIRIDAIAGDFFQTISVPLRAGRVFSRSDDADAPRVAIINETMARRFWPRESPVGKRFRTGTLRPDAPWIEVIGVVADMHRQGPERTPISQVFRPYVQAPSRNMNLLVRTDQPLPGLADAIRGRIAAIDRTVPLGRVTTLTEALDQYLQQRRFQTLLMGIFSAIALLLAAVGIYGLIQYSVAQRTREIGVRIALGAVSTRVVLMVLRQGLTVALPGLAVGIIAALWLSQAIAALLFGVAAADFTSIAVTAGVLLTTTLAACSIPARRAATVDPMTALRYR